MVRISSSQLDVIILLSLPVVFLIFLSFNVRKTKHIRATRRCVNILVFPSVLRIQTILIRIRILLITLIWIRIQLLMYPDPDPTAWYGSGSLPFQRRNVPKTVLFIHLNLIFLVSRSARTQPEGTRCKPFPSTDPDPGLRTLRNWSEKMIWIRTDPDTQHWFPYG